VFKKLRSANTVLVIASLLIAYFIWLIAKMGNVEEQVLDDVPILLDLPPWIETELSRKTLTIEVRYPKNERRDIYSGAFHALINDPDLFVQIGVRDAQAITVPLTVDDVKHPSLPASVQVQKIDPGRIIVWVKYRTVPARIIPRFAGQPAPGFYREKAIVNPPLRLLTGAKGSLDKLARDKDGMVELQTLPINLTEARDSFSTYVAVVVPNDVNVVDEETRQRLLHDVTFALVQVILKEETMSRTIPGIPIQVPTLSSNLVARVEPTSGSVTIAGPRSRVESLDPRMILLRPKNPPQEKAGFAGKIPIEARMDESVPPEISILKFAPDFVLLRYEPLPATSVTAPTLKP
jgi:hypothetical protein